MAGPPLEVLARAYDVPQDLSAVSAAIYERPFGAKKITLSIDTLGDVPREWKAMATLVGMLVLNSHAFARVRGGGRPTKPLRKSMRKMAGAYVSSEQAEEFVDRVMSEVASTLAEHR